MLIMPTNLKVSLRIVACLLIVVSSGCAARKPTASPPLATRPVTPSATTPAFDVPRLVGLLNLKAIKKKLGTPYDDTEPTLEERKRQKTWSKAWMRGDATMLLVTYQIADQSIVDFFLFTNESADGTRDKQSLLRAGNLRTGDPRYRIRFVPVKEEPDLYTGVTVIAHKRR
jgi:hypothetical protein